MMSEEHRRPRASAEQRDIMLQFMKRHPALGMNRFTARFKAKHKARLLKDLTMQLNSCGSGATKSPDKWLKSWQDWRSDVKSKAAKINETGGGPPLTPIEVELLAYMGEAAFTGPNVTDALDAPTETNDGVLNVEETITKIECDTILVDALPTDRPLERMVIPQPSPGPVKTLSSISSATSAGASKRKRTISSSSESSGATDRKMLEIATEQLNVQKRQMEIAEEQLKLSRDLMQLQRQQGDRYGAVFEKLADSVNIAAAALASFFKRG